MPQIGRKSMELDQYYTSASAVEKCLEKVDVAKYDSILEPSAGDGAFLHRIRHSNITAMDVFPDGPGIEPGDFLEYEPPEDAENMLVLGNPPFGIRHSLSDAFLTKSFSLPCARCVAFILPNTYNKPTRQKLIPGDWRIASITGLEPDSFTYKGEPRHMPCSFFVFDRSPGQDLRFDGALYAETEDFQFANAKDFDLFVFGANPGRTTPNPLPNNRGHYLKSLIPVDELARNFAQIEWHGNSCASGGVAWFSKPEIVKHYIEK